MARRLGILGFARDLLCPPSCRICKSLTGVKPPWGEAPLPLCERCMPLWVNETHETCGICAQRVTECFCMPKPLEEVGAMGLCKCLYYDPHKSRPVQNRLIYRVKKKSDYAISEFFAMELSHSLAAILERDGVELSDVIITYLPRSREAYGENGTDQAAQLARALSCRMELPLLRLIKRQHGKQPSQKKLTPVERIKNAKNAFCMSKKTRCEGKTVVLADDIVTTGASMSACTKILYKMGAKAVYCVSVAADAVNKDQ